MQISNPFYAAAPSLFNAGNPVTTLGAEANGNVEGVTANGVNVTADPGGMIAGFSIADVLTLADKAATGYDPASGKINTLANALASYRANGSLSGVASPSLIDALKSSLAKTGGYPDSPSALIGSAKSAGSNLIRYAQRAARATDMLAGGVGAGVVAAATKIEALVLFDTCMETLFLRSQ